MEDMDMDGEGETRQIQESLKAQTVDGTLDFLHKSIFFPETRFCWADSVGSNLDGRF